MKILSGDRALVREKMQKRLAESELIAISGVNTGGDRALLRDSLTLIIKNRLL